jgi:predicted aspartyl protease
VKPTLTTTVLFTFAFCVQTAFRGPAIEAQTMTATVPMMEVAGKEIVKVSMNGTGPYDFILDTGANVTLVSPLLFQKLSIPGGKSVTIVTTLGESQHQRAMVEKIAVAGLSVEHLEINTLDGGELGSLKGRIQGVLGENFLKYFDLLIDNEQQTLTLDRTSSLADALTGERLQFSRFGSFHDAPTSGRIAIQLKVPSYLQKPLLFLVDSGTNTAALYPAPGGLALRAMQSPQHGRMSDLTQSRDCQVQKTSLEIGSSTFRGLELVACEGLTRNKVDTDGLLPTRPFHRFFISHSGGYVIANPRSLEKLGEQR